MTPRRLFVYTVSDDALEDSFFPNWHSLDWQKISKEVRRLRQRIFIQSRKGNIKRVRQLQKLMLRSKSNYLWSIRTVTSNSGARTAGIDKLSSVTPYQKFQLFEDLQTMNITDWNPPPVKRIYFEKPAGGWRPIGIPTITDRIIQCIVKNALEPQWEALFEPSSFGFRPGRSVADAIGSVFVTLSMKGGKQWIVDCDIKGCFDNVSHGFLLDRLRDFPAISLIKKWLTAGYIEEHVYVETGLGFPQGSILSPLLCNITLHGLEVALNIKRRPSGHIRSSRIYSRYADDFVVLCDSYSDAVQVVNIIQEFMSSRGLKLKFSDILHITQGFDYVGFHIQWEPRYGVKKHQALTILSTLPYAYSYWDRGKGLITARPTDKSIIRIKGRLKEIFKRYRSSAAELLIREANAAIRGWAESKICGTSSRTFHSIDSYLYRLQFHWAKRGHPNKNTKWCVARYFGSINQPPVVDNWTFFAPGTEQFMFKFGWFKPYDHIKVTFKNCWDDPELQDYWVNLQYQRLRARPINPVIKRLDNDLMASQYWVCPVCEESLANGEELHIHHIQGRRFKNAKAFSNLLILHRECHYHVHYVKDIDWTTTLIEYKSTHPRVNLTRKLI